MRVPSAFLPDESLAMGRVVRRSLVLWQVPCPSASQACLRSQAWLECVKMGVGGGKQPQKSIQGDVGMSCGSGT